MARRNMGRKHQSSAQVQVETEKSEKDLAFEAFLALQARQLAEEEAKRKGEEEAKWASKPYLVIGVSLGLLTKGNKEIKSTLFTIHEGNLPLDCNGTVVPDGLVKLDAKLKENGGNATTRIQISQEEKSSLIEEMEGVPYATWKVFFDEGTYLYTKLIDGLVYLNLQVKPEKWKFLGEAVNIAFQKGKACSFEQALEAAEETAKAQALRKETWKEKKNQENSQDSPVTPPVEEFEMPPTN
jgi:hypothetical protein